MIEKATATLFGETTLEIGFEPGLNLISGANGTGKTRLLMFLAERRRGTTILSHQPPLIELVDAQEQTRVSVFGAIRSLQKTKIEDAYQAARTQDAGRNTLNSIASTSLHDAEAIRLSGFSNFLALALEKITETRRLDKAAAAAEVQVEFGAIVQTLFGYELRVGWDFDDARMRASIIKQDSEKVALEFLSTGETALLSLAASLYFSKDTTDVYLIDEPEVHLNWSLEVRLFSYLMEFADTHEKQLIVSTHSRTVFTKPLRGCTQFLDWDGGSVTARREPTADLRSAIAGDIAQTIQGLSRTSPLLYVEDMAQKLVVDAVASKLGNALETSIVGSTSAVESLAKHFDELNLAGAYFLVDGDNKTRKNSPSNLTALSRYAIENYLLDIEALNLVATNVDAHEILKSVVSACENHSVAILKEFMVHNPLLTPLEFGRLIDRIDGSLILDQVLSRCGFEGKKYQKLDEFLPLYLDALNTLGRLEQHFADLGLSGMTS